MVGKEIGERDSFEAGKTDEVEVFAEREGGQAVGGLASGEVASGGINPKKGRAGVDDGRGFAIRRGSGLRPGRDGCRRG